MGLTLTRKIIKYFDKAGINTLIYFAETNYRKSKNSKGTINFLL